MRRFLLLCLLVASPGCSAMMETMDRGLALEKEGKALERSDQFVKGAAAYAKAEVELAAALELAKERKQGVFTSLMNHKLSLVSTAQGRCARPTNDPNSTWDAAIEHYKRAGFYAARSAFLKLQVLSVCDRADCVRPDKNPAGSWEEAAKGYEKAAEISKGFDDEKGRGMALRLQAICLMEGNTKAQPTETARRLLEKARKLGDEDAADMLAESEGGYCIKCGRALSERNAQFCTRCGADQTPPVKKAQDPRPNRKPGDTTPAGLRRK